MIIEKIDKDEWSKISEYVHFQVFGTHRKAEWDRIDFALLCLDDARGVMGFVTAAEHDSHTLYWQFGGAMPKMQGKATILKYYKQLIDWCDGKYTRIKTCIENDNIGYLKLALTCGFKVTGIRFYHNTVFLELAKEFKKESKT